MKSAMNMELSNPEHVKILVIYDDMRTPPRQNKHVVLKFGNSLGNWWWQTVNIDFMAWTDTHWEIGTFPTQQLPGDNVPRGTGLVVAGPWQLLSCKLCNFTVDMGSCFYSMTHWSAGHWVLGNCTIPITNFLHWFGHWSWENNHFIPNCTPTFQQTTNKCQSFGWGVQ